MLGPFVDTLVVCTMTALVIISTGVWKKGFDSSCTLEEVTILEAPKDPSRGNDQPSSDKEFASDLAFHDGQPQSSVVFIGERGEVTDLTLVRDSSPITGKLRILNGKAQALDGEEDLTGVEVNGKMLLTAGPLTTQGFASGFLGKYANYFVTLAIPLFAYSTMLAWSYYGDRSIGYLLGHRGVTVYKWVFVVFVVLGAVTQVNVVWNFSSIMNCLMAAPNLVALLGLSAVVAIEKRTYLNALSSQRSTEGATP